MADDRERRDRPPLAFDLRKAIEEARAEFPEQTKAITFLDLSAPDIRNRLLGWLDSTDPVFREKYLEAMVQRGGTIDEWIDTCLRTGGFSLMDVVSGKTIVAARSELPAGQLGPIADTGRMLAYIFAHELGHALVEGGHSKGMLTLEFMSQDPYRRISETNRAENAADAFAALYGLRKGWLDAGDIERLSVDTSGAAALLERFTHFTSIALGHIVLNREGADFMSLTMPQIQAIAARHAEEFSLDADAVRHSWKRIDRAMSQAVSNLLLTNLQSAIRDSDDFDSIPEASREDVRGAQLKGLAEIYLRGMPPRGGNPIPYFIAQSVLAEVLNQGNIPGVYEKADMQGPYWDGVRKVMADRAGDDTLPALLDALAQNKRDMLTLKTTGVAPGPAPVFEP